MEVLAKIHSVDISSAGLSDFGKTTDYMKRNLARYVLVLSVQNIKYVTTLSRFYFV